MLKTLHLNKAVRAIDAAAAEFYQAKVMQGVCRMRLNNLGFKTRELAACFAGRLVSDLTANDVRTYIAMRKNTGPATINARIEFMSCFLNWSKRRGYCDENVAEAVDKARSVETPVGILRPDELARLLAAADPCLLTSPSVLSADCAARN